MENPSNELSLTVDKLFAGTTNKFMTASGKEVIIKQAKLKEIAAITRFIDGVVSRAPRAQMESLFNQIVDLQERLMREGKSPYDVSDGIGEMIAAAMDNRSLILTIFASTADLICEFAPVLSNVSSKEFEDDLTLDEQMVLTAGTIAVNYHFFTRSLPPILKGIFSNLKLKRTGRASSNPAKVDNVPENPVTVAQATSE